MNLFLAYSLIHTHRSTFEQLIPYFVLNTFCINIMLGVGSRNKIVSLEATSLHVDLDAAGDAVSTIVNSFLSNLYVI